MRRSVLWFVLALAWALDCVLSLVKHNWVQTGLTALFATCFMLVGLMFRRRELQRIRRMRQ